MYIVGKHKILETGRKVFGKLYSLFCSDCKLILYFQTMHVYSIYPAMPKSPKTTAKLPKIEQKQASF